MEPKLKRIINLLNEFDEFRACGPSDDLELHSIVCVDYHHLVTQLKVMATPYLPKYSSDLLNSVEVELNDIYSVYMAMPVVSALLGDIREIVNEIDGCYFGYSKKDRILNAIKDFDGFKICTPSADPDRQSAVCGGYFHMVTQLQIMALPYLPESIAEPLSRVEVDLNDIYTVYEARAIISSILGEIEDTIKEQDESVFDPAKVEIKTEKTTETKEQILPTAGQFRKLGELFEKEASKTPGLSHTISAIPKESMDFEYENGKCVEMPNFIAIEAEEEANNNITCGMYYPFIAYDDYFNGKDVCIGYLIKPLAYGKDANDKQSFVHFTGLAESAANLLRQIPKHLIGNVGAFSSLKMDSHDINLWCVFLHELEGNQLKENRRSDVKHIYLKSALACEYLAGKLEPEVDTENKEPAKTEQVNGREEKSAPADVTNSIKQFVELLEKGGFDKDKEAFLALISMPENEQVYVLRFQLFRMAHTYYSLVESAATGLVNWMDYELNHYYDLVVKGIKAFLDMPEFKDLSIEFNPPANLFPDNELDIAWDCGVKQEIQGFVGQAQSFLNELNQLELWNSDNVKKAASYIDSTMEKSLKAASEHSQRAENTFNAMAKKMKNEKVASSNVGETENEAENKELGNSQDQDTGKQSGETTDLKSFIENHCVLTKGMDVISRKTALFDANKRKLITLPTLARPYKKGRANVYYVKDLKSNWQEFRKEVSLPALKEQKS